MILTLDVWGFKRSWREENSGGEGEDCLVRKRKILPRGLFAFGKKLAHWRSHFGFLCEMKNGAKTVLSCASCFSCFSCLDLGGAKEMMPLAESSKISGRDLNEKGIRLLLVIVGKTTKSAMSWNDL